MQLETSRLTLRSFREDDVDAMAELFATPDFMRFSLGAFTRREQPVAFIQKVIGWDKAGLPSQLAVIPRGERTVIVAIAVFYITRKCQTKSKLVTGSTQSIGTAV